MKKVSWLLIVISVLTLLPLRSTSWVIAQDGESVEANKAVLRAFFEAEAAREYDRMDEFFVEDFVRHSVATTAVMPEARVTNRQEYIQLLQGMAATFPDYYTTVEMLVAENDYVAFYANWYGTFAENGNPTGGPMVGFARFEDGKIAELWIEWDSLTWTGQMMAAPQQTTEEPISSIEDIVGTWRIYGDGWAWFWQVAADGSDVVGTRGCAPDNCVERSQLIVEGSQVHFLSSELSPRCGEASYEGVVVYQNAEPVGLRFNLVGDDCYIERRQAFDGKTIYPAR